MSDDAIRGVVVTAHGGPDVLAVQPLDVPDPGPGQVLIAPAASGINFIDVYRREGVYPTTPPFVLGGEAAGPVLAVGPDVRGFSVGQLVASVAPVTGTHATRALLSAASTVPVPDGLTAETAAGALLQGMTAQYLTSSTYPVARGDRVLVHAAAGGVGQLLVQLVKARGGFVVATVGSAAKAEIARGLGADAVLRYDEIAGTDALAAAVREAAGGGVHVAYDSVGQATFDASLAALRWRGVLVLFGASSGQVPPFDPQRLNGGGSLYVTRPTLGHYTADRAELLDRAGEVFARLADGSLQLQIGGRYGLDRAAEAYRDLEARRTTGKLLMIP